MTVLIKTILSKYVNSNKIKLFKHDKMTVQTNVTVWLIEMTVQTKLTAWAK